MSCPAAKRRQKKSRPVPGIGKCCTRPSCKHPKDQTCKHPKDQRHVINCGPCAGPENEYGHVVFEKCLLCGAASITMRPEKRKG